MYVRKLAESGSRTQFLSTDVADNTQSHPSMKGKKMSSTLCVLLYFVFSIPSSSENQKHSDHTTKNLMIHFLQPWKNIVKFP